MRKVPVLTADEAVKFVKDADVVAVTGFVGSVIAEGLLKALRKRYDETKAPKDLTIFFAAGQGNRAGTGADRLAVEGLVKRVIGGHWNLIPELGKLVLEDKIEGYNFPQGTLSQLSRDIAAHKLGTLTHVGMNTYVDPLNGGGKLNKITKEDLVFRVNVLGEDRLLYKAFPINVSLLRGTYADESGNVTLEDEVTPLDSTSFAQAAKNSGGKVIVQVKKVVANGSLDPKLVKIPGIYVDAIVVVAPEDQPQCLGMTEDDPSYSGHVRSPLGSLAPVPLDVKKVIGRRGAMELKENSVVNLGIGAPEFISAVANEEGIGDYMTLTVEAGPIGGVPLGGSKFGAAMNPECMLDQGYQFDFYDGGGIDYAFLGLAEADETGNVNVSKFGPRIAGCGGFINITQNAKRTFFCGTFTAGGLKTKISNGKLEILQEGKEKKLLKAVEHITFSGEYAKKIKQPVLYITERAVFELREDGVYLTEVAPGIDVQTQILDLMGFVPKIDGKPKLMDERIFKDELMGLKK
jgi:propionate CoA-transferase